MTYMVIVAIGAVFAAGTAFSIRTVGMHREAGTFAMLLMSIAFFYVVFALEHGDLSVIVFNIIAASAFSAAALFGYQRAPWLLVGGVLAHGAFDVIYPLFGSNPAPHWWAPVCLGYDLVLAGVLAFWVSRGELVISSASSKD